MESFSIHDGCKEFDEKYPDGMTIKDLVPFYQMYAEEKPLVLEWKCLYGRMNPCTNTGDNGAKKEADKEENRDKNDSTNQPSTQSILDFGEFEFQEPSIGQDATSAEMIDPNAVISAPLGSNSIRRMLGKAHQRTPREHKVATMGNIYKDYIREKKEKEEELNVQKRNRVLNNTEQSQQQMTSSVENITLEESVAPPVEEVVHKPLSPPPTNMVVEPTSNTENMEMEDAAVDKET